MKIVQILLPMPLPEAFDYKAPKDMDLAIGDFVEIPFGNLKKIGVIWGFNDNSTPTEKIKPIIRKLPSPPLSLEAISFIDWTARYLVVNKGQILAQILRPLEALKDGPFVNKIILGDIKPDKLSAKSQMLWDYISCNNYSPQSRNEICDALGIGAGIITNLIKQNALHEIKQPLDTPFLQPKNIDNGETLNAAQATAKNEICRAIDEDKFKAFLLDGVTGSGKTEVYLEAIAYMIDNHDSAQILVLLPEIALTQAIIQRITQRFGSEPIIWHYELGVAQKRRAWRMINNGNARIIIGARSAVFLPFKNLKLIIIDEEHDNSFKQEDGLRYQARDLAIVRAKYANAAIVLASATPSLESRNNALSTKYRHLVLANRYGSAVLPNIELVNLKEFPPPQDHWISPILLEQMADTLQRGEQVLLFLNRRGFAPVVLCSKCGHKMVSPNSDSWLVEHRFSNMLVCHLTGYKIKKPVNCPSCHGYKTLVSIGPGVERIADEAKTLFPKKRIEVLSSDIAHNPQILREIVNRMENNEIDILVGTQITAKGHNFPNLSLVGIIDGDLGLKGGDPRAGEKTYQLLTQVAGRAGRMGQKSKAIIQTYYPENEAFQALLNHNREGFLDIETQMRAAVGFPPFGRLACLHLLAKSEEEIEKAAKTASDAIIKGENIEIWGPSPPPITLVRGWHRRRFLIRADKNIDLSKFMHDWRAKIKLPPNIRLIIDIEPYNFM